MRPRLLIGVCTAACPWISRASPQSKGRQEDLVIDRSAVRPQHTKHLPVHGPQAENSDVDSLGSVAQVEGVGGDMGQAHGVLYGQADGRYLSAIPSTKSSRIGRMSQEMISTPSAAKANTARLPPLEGTQILEPRPSGTVSFETVWVVGWNAGAGFCRIPRRPDSSYIIRDGGIVPFSHDFLQLLCRKSPDSHKFICIIRRIVYIWY